MAIATTMLDLVTSLTTDGRAEEDVVATVVELVNSGQARLTGNFRGRRIESTEMRPVA